MIKREVFSGLFIFIGFEPNTGFLKGVVDLDDEGYVVTNPDLETNVPGVYACGDVRNKFLRQMVVACGEGAIAAVHAQHRANRLRSEYWHHYGTTLRGLIERHRVDPGRFLAAAHAIDYGALRADPRLHRAIAGLKGRKIVHTNGSRAHASAVLAARGLVGAFDAVFAIEDKALVPKPQPKAYAAVHRLAGLEPRRSAMVEDDARNLEVPKTLGMATVWLCHADGAPTPAHVDRRIARLTEFLEAQAGAG